MLYTLTKLPDGPQKVGELSYALTYVSGEVFNGRAEARPAVGEQMLVGARVRISADTPGVRITSPIVRIVSDEPGRVIFETESGSIYEWTCCELDGYLH
jgi:hypothetical protein